MIILMNELEKAKGRTLPLEGNIDISTIKRADITSFEHFRFAGQAVKEGEIVTVQGSITGLLLAKCSKCLASVEYRIELPFKERFTEGSIDEESDLHPIHGGQIELDLYLQQAVHLELPHVFECSADCKGLCPSCGMNRNEQSCACVNERIDPRLADLALFFQKNNE